MRKRERRGARAPGEGGGGWPSPLPLLAVPVYPGKRYGPLVTLFHFLFMRLTNHKRMQRWGGGVKKGRRTWSRIPNATLCWAGV